METMSSNIEKQIQFKLFLVICEKNKLNCFWEIAWTEEEEEEEEAIQKQ